MNNLLIIGRFQPVYNNHIELIRYAETYENYRLNIVVGVSDVYDPVRSPFLPHTVKQMLESVVYNKHRTKIYFAPDIHDPENYGDYILNYITSIGKDKVVLIGDNPDTIKCFTKFENVKLSDYKVEYCNGRASDFRKVLFDINDYKIPSKILNVLGEDMETNGYPISSIMDEVTMAKAYLKFKK